jgi:UDP-3-O-[3-hydroxymyristoyl] glucosamine N-acyltransferase
MIKTVKEIAHFISGEVVGDGNIRIKGVSGIKEAGDGDIAFILNEKFRELINTTKASCVVAPKGVRSDTCRSMILVDNPSIAFSKIISAVYPDRIPHPKGIHNSAVVSKTAKIGRNVAMGPFVVVEDGATVGDNTIIYPFCYIGKNVRIGTDSLFYPNVTIREEVSIGNRVIMHSGTVIGADGFGYDTKPDGSHVKIPQLGSVIIEDDVELGACTTVDRARFNNTIIGKGSKFDNLVQIAHNVVTGPYCLIAAQTGISGSSELGRNVVLGGQVGMGDHLKLGDFVMVGAKSGVTKSFPVPKTVLFGGIQARPVEKARELLGFIGLLPKLYARVKALEAKIKELEK